jgi:tetratricopeptide (TPR) repeat protein
MRVLVFLTFLLCCALPAADLEKDRKQELEGRVKTMTAEAAALEKSGQLVAARTKYAESQALIEVKAAADAIKRLDDEIRKHVKDALKEARRLYELGKFQEAGTVLEEALKLQAFQPVLAYNLALCYHQSGDHGKALEYARQANAGTAEPKQKQKVLQLLTLFTTGENGVALSEGDKQRIAKVNHLVDSIGLEASLDDEGGDEDVRTAAAARTEIHAGHRSSLCSALTELKGTLTASPSATFDLANCAETNGRTQEAVGLLGRYLEMAPNALDAAESRARIADLNLLLALPDQAGTEIRRLDAAAYGALAERNYDRALAAFQKSEELAPEFAATKWKLALLYEAMGNVDRAKEKFTSYVQLVSDPGAKDDAGIHLASLDAKRTKYDEEVDAAGDIIADLLNRAMNLTFNGSEKRSALRAKRAQVKNKNEKARAQSRVGGFAVPYAYAQQQLARASGHLQIALALFPLGAEANELMGLVFLQANDGQSATRSFDAVASQSLPVAFYGEMRGKKQDRAVKCELTREGLRLIFLSSYDKKGNPAPPAKPAGEDGLGDMVIAPSARRPQVESLEVPLSEIKQVGTDKGLLKLKLARQEIWLSPIYLPSYTPVEGPQARRFANNYTRLFVRYPGLENSKLGAEGMTGGEKFKMGYKIAMAGMDIATGGFSVMGAISSVQDAISIARTIQSALASLRVSFAAWEKSVDDQQQLLAGKAFKSIPVQPVSLAFVQEIK